MKSLAAALLIIAALLLDSCGPAATFDKPQPDKVKSLASFPQRLQGEYVAAGQVSVVTITGKLILRHYDFDMKDHKDSLGSSYKLVGDKLIDQEDGTEEKVLVIGDTVIKHVNWTDTLFNISADHVLKRFKGYYFLSNRYDNNAWEAKKLSLEKGVLTIGSLSREDDIEKLEALTETAADTTTIHFTLTRRQFKKFIRQDGFSEQETFHRITENGR